MPFLFSLQAVLHLRERAEEREEILLSEILGKISEERARLHTLAMQLATVTELRAADVCRTLRGFEIQEGYTRYLSLKQDITAAEEQLTKWERLRTQQMEKYVCARRDREIVQELKLRQRHTYDLQRASAEQKSLDEGYLLRLSRR